MGVSKCASFAAFILFCHLYGVFSEQVQCVEQQEVCECDIGVKECEFTLTVEELQTFTSYEIENPSELIRGTRGRTYYLDDTGYRANRRPSDDPISCAIPLATSDEDFTNFNGKKCSVPVTVDGATYRLFIAVNGRMPGPTLIVDEGAVVRVSVINKLTSEGITIHWHGMHQKGTPWMDGVGFISQAPITPGATFDYVFTATPAGTHWYHSHVGAQRTDGLFGALVVREAMPTTPINEIRDALVRDGSYSYNEIVDMPSAHTLTLLDWQREASLNLFVRIQSSLRFYYGKVGRNNKEIGKVPVEGSITMDSMLYDPPTRGPDSSEVGPVPYWSGLINGRGQHSSSTYSPLSIFTVEVNKAYRFRIVGAQSLYAYSFSIDGHMLRVIATDGHFIQPVNVHYIIVHSGERYDFVLETFGKTIQNYWVRAETLEILEGGVKHSAVAILRYTDGSNLNWGQRIGRNIQDNRHSCTADDPCKVLNCPFKEYPLDMNRNCIKVSSLKPFSQLQVSFTPCFGFDCTKFFNFGFEGISDTSAVNGKNFRLPVTPYQTNCKQPEGDRRSCSDCTGPAATPECRCIHVERIMETETFAKNSPAMLQTMVFSAVGNEGNFAHPVHLHGHSFHVLHIGYFDDDSQYGVVCNNELCSAPMWKNNELPPAVSKAMSDLGNKILKDTVNVPAGGYVVVAFPADNPGYWFLHCHIEVHQLEGMGVLIEEYPYQQHTAPPEGIDNTGNFQWSLSNYQSFKERSCEASLSKSRDWERIFSLLAIVVLSLALVAVSVGFGCYCCRS